ncbi:MAG: hypothetical protein Q4C96_01680, partial [Planctomycetia bacterium]|nr:hypothetical protein [Planctomycetia bacterium]
MKTESSNNKAESSAIQETFQNSEIELMGEMLFSSISDVSHSGSSDTENLSKENFHDSDKDSADAEMDYINLGEHLASKESREWKKEETSFQKELLSDTLKKSNAQKSSKISEKEKLPQEMENLEDFPELNSIPNFSVQSESSSSSSSYQEDVKNSGGTLTYRGQANGTCLATFKIMGSIGYKFNQHL